MDPPVILCFVIVLLYDVVLDLLEEISTVIAVDIQRQLLGEVKAENTHDGLCVDRISAGYDIYIVIAAGYDTNEILYVVDGVDVDLYCFHKKYFLSLFRSVVGSLCSELCH